MHVLYWSSMVNLCIKLLKQSGIANLSISVLFSLSLASINLVCAFVMHILHSQGNNNQSIYQGLYIIYQCKKQQNSSQDIRSRKWSSRPLLMFTLPPCFTAWSVCTQLWLSMKWLFGSAFCQRWWCAAWWSNTLVLHVRRQYWWCAIWWCLFYVCLCCDMCTPYPLDQCKNTSTRISIAPQHACTSERTDQTS